MAAKEREIRFMERFQPDGIDETSDRLKVGDSLR